MKRDRLLRKKKAPARNAPAYKARFKGVEIFRDGGWRQLDLEDDFSRDKNLREIKSISEQVAHIAMPEMTHSHET